MAEGGCGNGDGGGRDDPSNNEPNPYSFQKFIKTKSKKDDDDDKARPNSESAQPARTRREENPFSFKQFLNKDTHNKPKVYSLMVDDISETCGGSRARTLNPDLATDLPDFVQDHLSDSNQEARLHKNNYDRNSTRLSASSEFVGSHYQSPNRSFPDLAVEDAPCNANSHVNGIDAGSDDLVHPVETNDDSNSNNESASLPLSLPDFLSDGPMLNHVPLEDEDIALEASRGYPKCPNCQAVLPEGNNIIELDEMRRINSELMQQLDSSQSLADSATKKVLKLEKEVTVLKSKEADETAALEEMVRQVEHNLKLTTQRAIKAENSVVKLKQEMKILQSKASTLSKENESLKMGGASASTSEDITSKADNLSVMLSCAAGEAETSLKQLMRGVEHLRFLSSVAKNINKVTDPTSQNENCKLP